MPINAVQLGSSQRIIESLEQMKADALLRSKWLNSNNNYQKEIVNTLKKEFRKAPHLPKKFYYKDLRHYTASSMILHNSDGWTFLARAVDSVISGDIPSALFFAYYAELRALMSIFAGNGICILDKPHLYIKSNGKTETFCPNSGTHIAVLDTLKKWINDTSRTDQLLNWIKVDNTSLNDWLTKSGRAFRVSYLAKDWLKKWSVDIDIIEKDHFTRNEVSYRPNDINLDTFNFDYKENVLKVISYLECCEPSHSDSFYGLDKFLLRISLETIFNQLPFGASSNINRIKTSKAYKKDFEKFLDPILTNLGKSTVGTLKEFLLRNIEPNDPNLLIEANKPNFDKATKTFQATPMISRALLLLRMASGSCEHMLKKSSLNRNDLEFWWGKYGNKHGFWEPNDFPDDIKDIWSDLSLSLENIKHFCNVENVANLKSMEKVSAEDMIKFKQVNRVSLWGIGL